MTANQASSSESPDSKRSRRRTGGRPWFFRPDLRNFYFQTDEAHLSNQIKLDFGVSSPPGNKLGDIFSEFKGV